MEAEHDPAYEEDLLRIAHARIGTVTLLTARGEVDLTTGPLLRSALHEAVEDAAVGRRGAGMVVLDLAAVSLLGSTGLAVLVDADGQAADQGVVLAVVVKARGPVARALQAAALDDHLTIYPDVAAALQATTPGRSRPPAPGRGA